MILELVISSTKMHEASVVFIGSATQPVNKTIYRLCFHEANIIARTYAPNFRAPKYSEQILTVLKGELDSEIIIAWKFLLHFKPQINNIDRKSINSELE